MHIWGAILSIPIAMYFKVAPKDNEASIFVELPLCIRWDILVYNYSNYHNYKLFEGNQDDPKGINLTKKLFATNKTFNIGAFSVLHHSILYASFGN